MNQHADLMVQGTAARMAARSLQPEPLQLVAQDFTDVSGVLAAYGTPVDSEFMRKVNARLEQFKAAARGGRITRAEFEEFYKLLMQRARAAASAG
jgi:hypothetical protein